MTTVAIQHSKDEFTPKRPSQKLDWQHLHWRMANSKLREILESDDPFWITQQIRGYFSLLEKTHKKGIAGSLLGDTAVMVQIVFTDGETVHDRRMIHPHDFAQLNEAALVETGGEIWWEMRPFDV